ncbi:hypothetical protein HYPSUDRAFT_197746 [Hypholoma sublateritium FD-334 SS-4]|uniref:Uncharacterized protein n=1 Tax=Hypholoma sublateritium (strain FD-334 SS-4) TaxID=945553 RepID=A0A0D2PBL7_HYPSF|nr:hypothetical protein HYPSUDRAFT_197746 [Hypholoma sublateritium FD-334 SS-4]
MVYHARRSYPPRASLDDISASGLSRPAHPELATTRPVRYPASYPLLTTAAPCRSHSFDATSHPQPPSVPTLPQPVARTSQVSVLAVLIAATRNRRSAQHEPMTPSSQSSSRAACAPAA